MSSPQSDESLSNPGSPTSSDMSSPGNTPTNERTEEDPTDTQSDYSVQSEGHLTLVPKVEAKDEPPPTISPAPPGSAIMPNVGTKGYLNHVPDGVELNASYLPSSSGPQHNASSTLLMPPYMADPKGGPEGITLSNYVKLMTLQGGGNVGYGMLHPSQQQAFHTAASQTPIGSSVELAAVVPPTTLPPQYQDMGYHAQRLLVNQTQQLNALAGFQRPLPKASNLSISGQPPIAGVKSDKDSSLKLPSNAFQQDFSSLHSQPAGMTNTSASFRTSSGGQVRRRTIKRAHDQSIEQGETGVDSGVDVSLNDQCSHGSLFPPDSGGKRDEGGRRQGSSDIVAPVGGGHSHQLKWQAHMVETWKDVCDASLIDIPAIGFHVETDKGFNFSIIDDSFVCQKKNHFQITVSILFVRTPKFVKMKNGSIQPIERFHLNLHGIRFEQVNSHIQLEQSQSDRTKVRYQPDTIEIPENPEKSIKRTVCRLHFSETTQNNMRKRGKPNPDQKHFSLVVALHAETPEGTFPVVAHVSERIVVRASNPGNFDNDSDYLWYKASSAETIFHHGRVGINTDKPDEALSVHGNIQVTGQILQVSDCRVKKNIQPVEVHNHLENISRLQLYRYQLDESVCSKGSRRCGLNDRKGVGTQTGVRRQMGLLAQKVRQVLPDAVMETHTDVSLSNGERVPNLLMVDKDQVLMETIGAVQELAERSNKLSQQFSTLLTTHHQCCTNHPKEISPSSNPVSHHTTMRLEPFHWIICLCLLLAFVCNILLACHYLL